MLNEAQRSRPRYQNYIKRHKLCVLGCQQFTETPVTDRWISVGKN